MFSKKSQRAFSIVAGVCFAILALIDIISFSSTIFSEIRYYIRYGRDTYRVVGYWYLLNPLFSATMVVTAILTLKNKKALSFVGAFGVYVSLLYWNIVTRSLMLEYIRDFHDFMDYVPSFIYLLAYGILFILAFMNCIPGWHKRGKIQKCICFIPAGLMVLYWVVELFGGFFYYSFYNVLNLILEISALFFAGMWLVDGGQTETTSQNGSVTPEAPAFVASTTQKNAAGGAEKLMEYKKLLDEGIITEAEFEEKKQQILELYF